MKIGVITYDHNHLKTEQIVNRLIVNQAIEEIILFALPFVLRKKRKILFHHRPSMTSSIHTKNLGQLKRVTFKKWNGLEIIGDQCDLFIVGGAGILNTNFSNGKPIFNVHPGIIPIARGLDSFKWSIYFDLPLGNTLHLIDNEVDKGDVITVRKTNVFNDDTIVSLARRHYENEIDLLCNVPEMLERRELTNFKENPATMRMKYQDECLMIDKFATWKSKNLT